MPAGSGEPPPSSSALRVTPGMLLQLMKLPFSLAQCVIFRMLARTGQVKRTGMVLGVSPTAISRNVASLEQVPRAPYTLNPKPCLPTARPRQDPPSHGVGKGCAMKAV